MRMTTPPDTHTMLAPPAEPVAAGSVEKALLWAVLLVALAVRVRHHLAGVPFAVGIDEPGFVERALKILQTGDWNTHAWDYPSLVTYIHAIDTCARYLVGVLRGEWNSLSRMNIAAVYQVGRVATALMGTATVWLCYRMGRELGSARAGLAGAALLAVMPLHVRESHFMLTDVPMAAAIALTVWLAMRAGNLRTVSAYAWAGAAAGLSAAAKYNGGVAVVAVGLAWVVFDRSSADRGRKAAAALGATAGAFLLGAPYTVLALPDFLEGFGAAFGKFVSRPLGDGGDPVWLIYYKHMAKSAWLWMPTALVGVGIAFARRATRVTAIVPIGFGLVYFYVLASHRIVFARYALPMLPVLCLTAGIAIDEVARRIHGWLPAWRGPRESLVMAALTLVFVAQFGIETGSWLQAFQRPDTRTVAARWLWNHAPRGARVAVENNGPTYLGSIGLTVTLTERIIDRPLESFVGDGFDYLVISTEGIDGYEPYLHAGPVVFTVAPAPDMWGPRIRIVKIDRPAAPAGTTGTP